MDARDRHWPRGLAEKRDTIKAPQALLAIPLAFLAAAIAGRAILTAAPPAIAVDLAQPLVVVTAWSHFGMLAWSALALPMAIAAIAQIRVLREQIAITTVISLSVVAMACAWFVPFLFSSDIYGYAAYGDLARVGIDPYLHGAVAHAAPDALLAAANWQWRPALPVCVYGPAFVALASVVASVFRTAGPLATLDAFRILACLALVACTAIAYRLYPGDARARALAAAVIGLNPVAIWSAVEGHNDGIMLAIVLGGWLMARRFPVAGTAIAALGFLIKAPAIVAPAVMVAFAAPSERAKRAVGAIGGTAIALLLCAHQVRDALAEHGQHGPYDPHASLQALVLFLVHGAGHYTIPVTVVVTALVMGAVAILGVRTLRAGDPSGYGYLALAAWCANPVPFPWYGVWLLPVAAISPQSRASKLLLAAVLIGLLRYLPDAATFL